MRKTYTVLFLMLCVLQGFAQERIIAGTVKDGDLKDEPFIRVTISKGSGKVSSGTITNYEDKSKLPADKSTKEITVNYIGYITQTIKSKAGVNHYKIVLMLNVHSVDEVMMTGYQRIGRHKLTAAVTTVDISDKAVGAIKNISQALVEQIAGLSTVGSSGAPGASVKIRIRGTAFINDTQEPLQALDDVPLESTDVPSMENLNDIDDIYQTSIAGVNPSDIGSTTVLKDAVATAIYGVRAANGVVVIITKRGKEGHPMINLFTKYIYGPKLNVGRLNLLNVDGKVDLELGLLGSDYTFRENKGEIANILKTLNETEAYKKSSQNASLLLAQTQVNALRSIDTDWNGISLCSTFNQEYNASVAGGSDRAKHYTSIGYYDKQGGVRGVDNKRFSVTLKTDYHISKILRLSASVYANQHKQSGYLTDTNGFTNPMYYLQLANPHFRPFIDEKYNCGTNMQGKKISSLNFNVFEERRNGHNRRTDRSMMAIFDAELQFVEDLKLTSQLGLQHDNYSLEKYAGESSHAMGKEKLDTAYDFKDSKRSYSPEGGTYKITSYNSLQWTWKAILKYVRRLSKIYDVGLLVGSEVRHIGSESIYSVAYGYDVHTLTTYPVVSPSEVSVRSLLLHRENKAENAYVSWFATGPYMSLYRYTLGGSAHFDGSDVFGAAKKHRYLPLYSVSASWHVRQKKFLRNAKWLNNFALCTSYGIQGNIDKNASPCLIGLYDKTSILPGRDEQITKAETAPNPDLRWGKTKNVNLRTDTVILNNALTSSVDYYYRRSSGLTGMRMLLLETGSAATATDWTSMENRGWETALGSRNVYTEGFYWTINLNSDFSTNKMLNKSVAENSTYPGREGYPAGTIFAYKTTGLDAEGYPVFVSAAGEKFTTEEFLRLNEAGTGTLSIEEQWNLYTYTGTTDPKVPDGPINHSEYRDWQLGMNFIFNLGMKVRIQPTYSPTNYDRGLSTNRDILGRWIANHTNTTFPCLMVSDCCTPGYAQYSEYDAYSMLDTWMRNNGYIRLQSVWLGHKLSKTWVSRVGIVNASVSVEACNLFVLTRSYTNHLGPETMGNSFAQPIPKSVIFGLNLNF